MKIPRRRPEAFGKLAIISSDFTEPLPSPIFAGCNINHPDLEPNLWRNLAEIEGQDGVDDDGNGFVDDKFGFNFADGNDDLSDPTSHGTHVAGVFAAEANNGVGIAGQ